MESLNSQLQSTLTKDHLMKHLSTEQLQELKESYRLLKDLKKWRQENEKYRYFEPTGPQERFIDMVGSSGSMVGIFSASNASGKTALVANLIGNIVFGPQNPFFNKHEIFKDWTFPKRIRYITDPKLVEEIGPFHSEIEKWWPKGRYEALKAGRSYFSQYKANGFIIDVMSYDQDVRQFEGGTLGLIICDEPPPRSIWHACISRLRLGGLLLVFMTPLTEAAWFFDEVVPNHQDHIVYASMEDACKTHGIRGFLEHDRIQSMIKEMDPDEVEARAYGKAMYLKGLVYKNFQYNAHVAKDPINIPEYAQIWHAVDPHVDKPFAMIWGFFDAAGTFFQVDEWPNEEFSRMHNSDLGLEDYKRIILTKERERGFDVRKRIIDRHFADTRSLQTNRTLREDLARVGIKFEPSYTANEEVETGILKVRSYLKYDESKTIDNLNQPKYVVDKKCSNTIKAFQRWSFDTKTMKPKDEYKDFMDCVRYLLCYDKINTFTPSEPVYKKLYG